MASFQPSRRVPSFALLLSAVLACAACGSEGEHRVVWSGSIDTLPNGAFRVNNPAVGLWETGAEMPRKLVPETEIGALQGDPREIFSSVSGLAADDEGRILAIDRDTKELRFYAADGTFLTAVGRDGKGPGEYTAPNGLELLPSDSLLVVDQEGARYTVLGPDGGFGRTIQRQLPFYGWVFRGGVDDERVYEQFQVGHGEEAEPALMGTALRDPDAAMDTIVLPAVREPELHIESFEVRTERFGSYLSVPFAPGMVYELDGHGGVWFGRGDQFHLYHVTFDGDTLREITLEARPVPVTQDELDEWLASESVERFESRGGEIDTDRIPKVKPHFDGLTLDPGGNLWVSTPAAPGRVRFAVFDSIGRYLGPIAFDGERVPWISPMVANDRLYVVVEDELGVNRVRVFRIAEDLERLETADD